MFNKHSVARRALLRFVLLALAVSTILTPIQSAIAANRKPELLSQINLTNHQFLPFIGSGVDKSWPMAGANPERTSWTPEEVSGQLNPIWYKQIEPYIAPNIQIIAAYNTLFVSTARGLYALDADSGAEKWVYPTEMPLGNSPTISGGVAYVGGFDRKLHAINAYTGIGIWKFEARAGFDTNPLVAADLVMAGNRDGSFYAIYTKGTQAGQLAWKYATGGPIDFSAAYKDGVVFFASQDSNAYALNVQNGSLVWKSSKLPGAGFQTWWPVVYKEWVIFAGSNNYREGTQPGPASMITTMERDELYPNHSIDPRGTLVGPLGKAPGPWAANTPTIDTSKPDITANGSTQPVTEYLESKPWRRTYFVLSRATGQEYTTDFDNDGKPEYAPILWLGTHSGNRYPPVVGADGILYQSNDYLSDPWIPGGQVSGWQIGTPYISVISSTWNAIDEPDAYSAGGNLIYWNLCCDRISGAFNISIPDTLFTDRYSAGIRPATDQISPDREYWYWMYDLVQRIPGYNTLYVNAADNDVFSVFGGRNGEYGEHGLNNPPIPYKGKVFMHRSNAVIALGNYSGQPVALPMAKIQVVQNADIQTPDVTTLKAMLAGEVQKMINAGHLRPGYFSMGIFDLWSDQICGDALLDYWHAPGDTLLALINALPYLPPDLQTQTRTYLQSEFAKYPPYQYNHIGWKDGAAREPFITPPEVQADMSNMGPRGGNLGFQGWYLGPQSFYALWKYASTFGGAGNIYNASKSKLQAAPSNDYLIQMPDVLNAYIAGYIGYLELEKLAGAPESTNFKIERDRLLALRGQNFSKDPPDLWFQNYNLNYCLAINVSRNFMYMTPELASYLRTNDLSKVQQAVQEYDYVAPYWFVSKTGTALGEGAINHFYDYNAIFQAKALILQEPYSQLIKYLDAPAVPVGDLFYIQNLITLIQAAP